MATKTQTHTQTRTQILQLDDDALVIALEVLRAGGVVGVPTETVYGLAGDATHADAVAAIYAAKGRPSHNPLIAHMADLEMAQHFAKFSHQARQLAQVFWPGPLTMVLPLLPGTGLAPTVTAGGGSLAVRCPKGALGELARSLGRPLAAPSANRSGHVSPTCAMHVRDDLDGRIPLILDAGVTPMGLESTIVDMRDVPTLLRAGAVEREAIEAVLGTSLTSIDRTPLSPVAPGQLASHYAPSTPVRLDILPSDVRTGEVYLGFGEHHLDGQPNLSPAGDVAEAAHALYSALRDADRKDMQGIAIAPIPSKGLGEAIQDRLKRAATPP